MKSICTCTMISRTLLLFLFVACQSNRPCFCLVPPSAETTRRRPSTSIILYPPVVAVASPSFPTIFSRRSWVASLVASIVIVPVASCQAQDHDTTPPTAAVDRGGKPFAPRTALLPAARLKFVVDQMYELSTTLTNNNDKEDPNKAYQILVRMNDLWTTRPPLFRTKEERLPQSTVRASTSNAITAQLTTGVSSANKKDYQSIRQDLSSLPDRLTAMLNQADVQRQWGMLQYAESQREQGNELRAALNAYTSQLAFDGDAYLLTASPEERKRMIRNDELPSLAAVIASDLDRRDLYRNDFLTSMEDVQAELAYQLKQEQSIDATDVVELMQQAHAALSKWFDLIAPVDVQDAMDFVVLEEQREK